MIFGFTLTGAAFVGAGFLGSAFGASVFGGSDFGAGVLAPGVGCVVVFPNGVTTPFAAGVPGAGAAG